MSAVNHGEPSGSIYRERLSPSLWVLVSAALCGPMAALVVTPIDTTLALVIGALVGLSVVGVLVAGSPLIEVRNGMLRAGRAAIDVDLVGPATIVLGEEARLARGAKLDRRSWHVIRGGIDPVAIFPIEDPDDPAPSWVISTRTPDRLAAAVRRAQLATK